MPKELRKRGKKHKKSAAPDKLPETPKDKHEERSREPSWIVPARKTEGVDTELPFGCLDPDVKAYFRTVDDQIRAWQEDEDMPDEEDVDLDPNEGERSRKHAFVLGLMAYCSKATVFRSCSE